MPEETVLIQRLPVQRDDCGLWTHPAWPDDGEESAILKSWFAEHCLEFSLIELESDGPEEMVTEYFEQGLVNCTAWEPTMPPGNGWFIFSIHDTDDGPICVWVRRVAP
ncbi:hypothetical protein [Pseudomonas sp. 10S4]|uniref:hypothetical protein n=1 Tax=Pseudomonas sp. 10S4 TaxID=3048583 RepID=UPI002AC8EC75|nr:MULTISPECIES: hypothetical protein [unclassified Pseudomonas]MEB0226308.1 hypothetical protein [Pseudomonas sp. 5S1]MEB0298263.1 hypothetical protein [Pseudomonas sp. 10S4]WPX18181.1 hypothetical protein RHM58_31295 [Pseudomonas sp. 10S4]